MTRRREPDRGLGTMDRIAYDLRARCPVCGLQRNTKAHRAKAGRCSRILQARLAEGIQPA